MHGDVIGQISAQVQAIEPARVARVDSTIPCGMTRSPAMARSRSTSCGYTGWFASSLASWSMPFGRFSFPVLTVPSKDVCPIARNSISNRAVLEDARRMPGSETGQ
jgi:hypothetical protein